MKKNDISKMGPCICIQWPVLLSFLLCSLNGVVAATYGDFSYTVRYGIFVEITDYPSTAVGDIEIPASIDGVPVLVISAEAFSGCSGLTSINFPDSLNIIGYDAFLGCSGLTSINLPDSLHTLRKNAFANCTGLVSVSLGESYRVNGDYAFTGCSSLTNFSVDESHPTYSSVNGVLFDKTETILKLIPPSKASYIIPDSVTSIGDYAFAGCTALTQLTIPDSVTSIGDYAFEDCFQGYDLVVPESVTSIGDLAFGGSQPTSIVIHFNFYDDVENGRIGLQSIYYTSTPPIITNYIYDEKTDALFYDIRDGEVSITGCTQDVSGEMIIPSEIEGYPVTSIKWFEGTKLTSIVVPEGVTRLGFSAFYECYALETITLPDSLTGWEDSVFTRCFSLKEITIPKGVSEIPDGAFQGCRALSSVVIPNSITHIGVDAFEGCESLTYLDLPESVVSAALLPFSPGDQGPQYDPSGSYLTYVRAPFRVGSHLLARGFDAESGTILEIYYPDIADVLTYEIQNEQITITDCAPEAALRLEIPATIDGLPVTAIGPYAFEGCQYLTEVVIPETVSIIGEGAFFGNGLTRVNIPDGVTRIEERTFASTNIERITIPASVTHIAEVAFDRMGSVVFEGDAPVNILSFEQWAGNFQVIYFYQGAEGFSSSDNYLIELPSLDIDSDEDGWPDAFEIMLQTDADDPSDFLKTTFTRNGYFWNLRLEPFGDFFSSDSLSCHVTLEKSNSLGTAANWEPMYGWAFGVNYGDPSIMFIPIMDDGLTFYRVRVRHQ